MHLQESGEMYLETILILSQRNKCVRSIDVSEYMGFSKPSVSRAVGLLKEGGYLTVGPGGKLELTDAGRAMAEKVYDRHRILTVCLTALGVEPTLAAEDACKIEHHISDETMEAIVLHLKKNGLK